jgi:transposase
MPKKTRVQLSQKERQALCTLIAKGKQSAREMLRARILLKSAEGWTDDQIGQAFQTSAQTVRRRRLREAKLGAWAALTEQPRSGAPHKLSLEEEARLVALVCSPPPAGRRRWTVRLATAHAVAQDLIPSVAPETVRRVLKKTKSSPGKWPAGVMLKSMTTSSPR